MTDINEVKDVADLLERAAEMSASRGYDITTALTEVTYPNPPQDPKDEPMKRLHKHHRRLLLLVRDAQKSIKDVIDRDDHMADISRSINRDDVPALLRKAATHYREFEVASIA